MGHSEDSHQQVLISSKVEDTVSLCCNKPKYTL